jgi:hypothetical protein
MILPNFRDGDGYCESMYLGQNMYQIRFGNITTAAAYWFFDFTVNESIRIISYNICSGLAPAKQVNDGIANDVVGTWKYFNYQRYNNTAVTEYFFVYQKLNLRFNKDTTVWLYMHRDVSHEFVITFEVVSEDIGEVKKCDLLNWILGRC